MRNRYRLMSTVYDREEESQKVLPEKRIFLSVEGNVTEKEYFDGMSKYSNGTFELTEYIIVENNNTNKMKITTSFPAPSKEGNGEKYHTLAPIEIDLT